MPRHAGDARALARTDMTIYASEEGPPEEAIYAALGRLIYSFTQLEASLLNAIATALGDTDEAEIVVAGMNFRQAVDRFSVLYSRLEDIEFDGGLPAFCSTLSTLNNERNREIHSNWGFWGSGEPLRAKKSLRRNQGVAFSVESVNPEHLVELAARMSTAAETVYKLRSLYIEQRRSFNRDCE